MIKNDAKSPLFCRAFRQISLDTRTVCLVTLRMTPNTTPSRAKMLLQQRSLRLFLTDAWAAAYILERRMVEHYHGITPRVMISRRVAWVTHKCILRRQCSVAVVGKNVPFAHTYPGRAEIRIRQTMWVESTDRNQPSPPAFGMKNMTAIRLPPRIGFAP